MSKNSYPIRVLSNDLREWFTQFSDKFKNDYNIELKSNDLIPIIKIFNSKSKIDDVAELRGDQIIIYENFLQFHWGICYSLLTIFDLGIHSYMIKGKFEGTVVQNKATKKAKKTLEATLQLLKEHNLKKILKLPHPAHNIFKNDQYVKKANGLFCAGISFILYHEFAHHFYGHHTYNQDNSLNSIKEEYDCDSYAIEISLDNATPMNVNTSKLGAVLANISLLFLSQDISGGKTHPDTDDRIKNILNKYNFDPRDNIWGITGLAFVYWADLYNIKIMINNHYDCYKDMYDDVMRQLK